MGFGSCVQLSTNGDKTERVTIMLPTETEQNILAEYEAMINLLIPVIDSPEENTESFDEDADYAQ